MITGRWGSPSDVLLDLVAEADGTVRGVVNPGREHALVREGRFDATTGRVHLSGAVGAEATTATSFVIDGQLRGRRLHLTYVFGDVRGQIEVVRVEEYRPPRPSLRDRVRRRLAPALRWIYARSRPTGAHNRRALRARGESVESIVLREANERDIAALAELHVTTWNATYRTARGPTVATRTQQWTSVFARPDRRDFVLVLEDRTGRLVGFTWGRPHQGEFAGELSKIYLRWEYHGLGLGRRLMAATAQQFLDRGMMSFLLHAELTNPSIGFYDRLGGERLRDARGVFHGAYGWRDVRRLLPSGSATPTASAR